MGSSHFYWSVLPTFLWDFSGLVFFLPCAMLKRFFPICFFDIMYVLLINYPFSALRSKLTGIALFIDFFEICWHPFLGIVNLQICSPLQFHPEGNCPEFFHPTSHSPLIPFFGLRSFFWFPVPSTPSFVSQHWISARVIYSFPFLGVFSGKYPLWDFYSPCFPTPFVQFFKILCNIGLSPSLVSFST